MKRMNVGGFLPLLLGGLAACELPYDDGLTGVWVDRETQVELRIEADGSCTWSGTPYCQVELEPFGSFRIRYDAFDGNEAGIRCTYCRRDGDALPCHLPNESFAFGGRAGSDTSCSFDRKASGAP